MDAIIREWTYERLINNIDEIMKKSEEAGNNYAYRVGLLEGLVKGIKEDLKFDENIIGTLGIVWLKADVIKEFNETYDREPTEDELNDILENYLDLVDVGEDAAIPIGWDKIYSALDDWEKDNPQEEDDVIQE